MTNTMNSKNIPNQKRELEWFEYKDINKGVEKYRIVVLNGKVEDVLPKVVNKDGKLFQVIPELTTKDCRHIDGCVYLHPGNCPDHLMSEWCQQFQNMLADRKAWQTTTEVIDKKSIISSK